MAKKPLIKELDLTKHVEADITIRTALGSIRICLNEGDKGTQRMDIFAAAYNGPDDREVQVQAVKAHCDPKFVRVEYQQDSVWPPKREPDPKPKGTELLPDIENHPVVLSQKFYKGELADRILFASSGFGCKVGNGGGKVYGCHIGGEQYHATRINYITRMATEAEYNAAVKKHSKAT